MQSWWFSATFTDLASAFLRHNTRFLFFHQILLQNPDFALHLVCWILKLQKIWIHFLFLCVDNNQLCKENWLADSLKIPAGLQRCGTCYLFYADESESMVAWSDNNFEALVLFCKYGALGSSYIADSWLFHALGLLNLWQWKICLHFLFLLCRGYAALYWRIIYCQLIRTLRQPLKIPARVYKDVASVLYLCASRFIICFFICRWDTTLSWHSVFFSWL